MLLKEQYPVRAHAPNFDFWTGCREIKRCEESKRTLENPFASRLAELDTIHYNFSGLQINHVLFPLSFDLGEIGIFLALLLLALGGGTKDGKRFDAD